MKEQKCKRNGERENDTQGREDFSGSETEERMKDKRVG